VPAGWAPANLRLSVLAFDSAGPAPALRSSLAAAQDVTPPRVAVIQPPSGASVLADRPFTVLVSIADDVEPDSVELRAGGARVGSARLLGDTTATFQISLPLQPGGAPVPLIAVARDPAGNAAASDPVSVSVHSDQGPAVSFGSLRAELQAVTDAEVQSGYVQLLQNQPATITVTAVDDVGIASLSVSYGDLALLEKSFASPTPFVAQTVSFTPPTAADGAPAVLEAVAVDTAGHFTRARLVVESRRLEAPRIAIAVPAQGAQLVAGSIELQFTAVAGSAVGMDSIDVSVGGGSALHLAHKAHRDVVLV